ncbi:MAG: phage tail tape measure protein [Tannerellaceae bacterium]|jgi:TP901 family phage tail tape measure protein|nr:phage tail tape measure protein [Tannerellaceae bacterium]
MANNTQKANIIVTMDGKQAEKLLEALIGKSKELREEINAVKKEGNTPENQAKIKELESQFRATTSSVKEVKVQLQDVSDVIANLAGATEKQLGDAYKILISQVKTLGRSTQEYADKRKQIALLRGELDKINATGRSQMSMWDQLGKTIKRLASYILVYFGFNQLMAGMKKVFAMNVELSDQLTDIQKTTGISGRALSELSDDINKIDTRTAVSELNKLAYEAGKIGMTAKEDVMGFVRAGNQIRVALGEDLGEDAIKNIAKLNETMGVTKRLGVEKALLATGSAINELGQSSTASEAYLVDFAERLSGIASQAKLTIPQILALGSTLDQASQNVEVSATTMNRFITTLVSKTEQVAKAVGVTSKELSEALGRSTWEGLMLVVEKMAGKGGLAALAPIMGDLGSEGARMTAVLGAISTKFEQLKVETDIANKSFVEATSITEEYRKKNENLAATVEKIGKNIRRWFMGSGMMDWLQRQLTGIEAITRASQTAKEKFEEQLTSVRHLTSGISPLLDEYERLKDAETADEQDRLKTIINQIAAAIPGAVTEWDEYGKALAISTERAKEFIAQQQILLKYRNKEAIEAAKKEIKELEDQRDRQEKRIKEIEEKGGYTQIMQMQTSSLGGTKGVEYLEQAPQKLEEQIGLYADINANLREQEELLKSLSGDYLNDYGKALDDAANALSEPPPVPPPGETDEQRKERIKKELAAIDAYVDAERTALMKARINREAYHGEMIDSETKYNDELERIQFKALQQTLDISGLSKEDKIEAERKVWEFKLGLFKKEEGETEQFQKQMDELYEKFDLKGVSRKDRELLRLRQGFNDGTLLLEEALKKRLIDQEEYYRLIELLRQKSGEAEKRYYKEAGAKEDLAYLGESEDKERSDLREKFVNGLMNYDNYLNQLAILEMQYAEARLNIAGLNEEQLTKLREDYQELRFNKMKQMVDREKQIQQSYENLMKSSISGIGDAFVAMFSASEDAGKAFGVAMSDLAFDALIKLVDIWLMQMQAKALAATFEASATEIGSKGIAGIATSAIVAAAIQAALQVAKAGIKSAILGKGGSSSSATSGQRTVKGFAAGGYVADGSGGYTGRGGVYQPAGYVHKGEYVTPQWQMRDPVSFRYVQALDAIRQAKALANPLPRYGGYAEGGPTDAPIAPAPTDPRLIAVLEGVETLLTQMKGGIPAHLNYHLIEDMRAKVETSRNRGTRKK